MVKMVSLKKSAADKRAEGDALGSRDVPSVPAEDQGVTVNLDHHHLMHMGVGGGLKSGHKVEFTGRGEVASAHTESTPEGEWHRATLRLNKGALEHESERGGDEEKTSIKGDLEKSYAGAQKQSAALPDK